MNFQQRIPETFLDSRISLCQRVVRVALSRRFPFLVFLPFASPLSLSLHQEFKDMEEVRTLTCAGCAFWEKWAQRLQIWSTGIDKHDLARLETRCSGPAVCHESNINLVLAITYLNFHRLCRTLLPMSFVRMLMLDCITAANDPPSREHPIPRRWVWIVKDSVPTCERLGTSSLLIVIRGQDV